MTTLEKLLIKNPFLISIQALVEREWIQAGHPFASRHRYGCYTPAQIRPKHSGASFVLFLDCIYQLYTQFPYSFEFSSQMLILLYEHSYFSQYGTFLCDSEGERCEFGVYTRTTSLWSYLNRPDVLKNMLNPLYEPNPGVIWPSVAPISLELWNGNNNNCTESYFQIFINCLFPEILELYLRWIVEQKNSTKTMQQIQELVTQEKELRAKVSVQLVFKYIYNYRFLRVYLSQVIRLRKQISDLSNEMEDLMISD